MNICKKSDEINGKQAVDTNISVGGEEFKSKECYIKNISNKIIILAAIITMVLIIIASGICAILADGNNKETDVSQIKENTQMNDLLAKDTENSDAEAVVDSKGKDTVNANSAMGFMAIKGLSDYCQQEEYNKAKQEKIQQEIQQETDKNNQQNNQQNKQEIVTENVTEGQTVQNKNKIIDAKLSGSVISIDYSQYTKINSLFIEFDNQAIVKGSIHLRDKNGEWIGEVPYQINNDAKSVTVDVSGYQNVRDIQFHVWWTSKNVNVKKIQVSVEQ